MATVYQEFSPGEAEFDSANIPQILSIKGTNYPVPGLAFDADGDEEAYFNFMASEYGSGNLTLELEWYADTATSGVVRWGGSIAAITPNTDSQDIETDALDTENTADDTHLGTVGQRVHKASVTISNLDSLAADDRVTLRIRREGSHGNDTMAGDAILTRARVSYSDS